MAATTSTSTLTTVERLLALVTEATTEETRRVLLAELACALGATR